MAGDFLARAWEFFSAIIGYWYFWVTAVPFAIDTVFTKKFVPGRKVVEWVDNRWPEPSRHRFLKWLSVIGFVVASFQAFDHVNSELKAEKQKTVLVSPRWQPLSPSEQFALRDKLRDLPKLNLNVMCSIPTCYDLAESLKFVFEGLNWDGGLHTSYWDNGVSTGVEIWASDQSAAPVARAIEAVSNGRIKLSYKIRGPESSPSNEINLVIGRLPR